MDKTTKTDQLKTLVSLFSKNIAQYKSSQYDEANTAVYGLYDLTEDEIKVVEG